MNNTMLGNAQMNNHVRQKQFPLLEIVLPSNTPLNNFNPLQKLGMCMESEPSIDKISEATPSHIRHTRRVDLLPSLATKPKFSFTALYLDPLQLRPSIFTKCLATTFKGKDWKYRLIGTVRDWILWETSSSSTITKTTGTLSKTLSKVHWKQDALNLRNLKPSRNRLARSSRVLSSLYENDTRTFQLSARPALCNPCARTPVAKLPDGFNSRLSKPNATYVGILMMRHLVSATISGDSS